MKEDTAMRLGKIQAGVDFLLQQVEKINPCHNASDGKFCSTVGGSSGGGGEGDFYGKSEDAALTEARKLSNMWQYKLTDEERDVVTEYSEILYADINTSLRSVSSRRPSDEVKALDSAIGKSPLRQDITVYRGAGSRGGNLFSASPGSVVSDKGYVSTSLSFDVAKKYQHGGEVVARIKIPRGAKAASLGSLSPYPKEAEILLPRSSAFRVLGKTKLGETTVVDLEVVL